MFTAAGKQALLTFLLIMAIMVGFYYLTEWLFDWDSRRFVLGFFLLVYLVNFQIMKEKVDQIKEALKDWPGLV